MCHALLGTGDIRVNMTDVVPTLKELIFCQRRQTIDT